MISLKIVSAFLFFAATIGILEARRSFKCQNSTSAIVGGEQVGAGQIPYQVSIKLNGGHFCGGTIIDKRHILTAGHCVVPHEKELDKMTVTTGSIDLNGGDKHSVDSVHVHPQYNYVAPPKPFDFRNDVAVIKLKDTIQFNDKQSAIDLSTQDVKAGTTGVVSGWGETSENGEVPKTLYKVEEKTVTVEECIKTYGDKASDLSICALNGKGKGFCQGDSGGPFVSNKQIIGIVSGNVPCATGKPDVFTNVYKFVDFIKESMSK